MPALASISYFGSKFLATCCIFAEISVSIILLLLCGYLLIRNYRMFLEALSSYAVI